MDLTQYKIISDLMVGPIESHMIYILYGTHIICGSKKCFFVPLNKRCSRMNLPLYILGYVLIETKLLQQHLYNL